MARIVAFCGLDCGECEAYIATQKNDRAGLEATTKQWAQQFGGKEISPDLCICDGCSSGKRTSKAHAATCAIRLCATARGVTTCARCQDYGCDTLKGFFAFAPVLRDKLEAIRKEKGKKSGVQRPEYSSDAGILRGARSFLDNPYLSEPLLLRHAGIASDESCRSGRPQ